MNSIRVRVVENKQNLVLKVRQKLKKWLNQLSPEERAIVVTALQKNKWTTEQLLNWCGDARDKLDGKDDDEKLKQLQFQQKVQKDALNKSQT